MKFLTTRQRYSFRWSELASSSRAIVAVMLCLSTFTTTTACTKIEQNDSQKVKTGEPSAFPDSATVTRSSSESGEDARSQELTDRKHGLLAKTQAKDAYAAVERFAQANRCFQGAQAKAFLDRKTRESGSWANQADQMRKLSQEQLDAIEQRTQLAREYETSCKDSAAAIESGGLYDLAQQAADAGDAAAGYCYASGMLPSPKEWESDESRQIQYRMKAREYIDEGLRSGDWRAVVLALQSSSGGVGRLASVMKADPEMAYELTKLQRLGSSRSVALELDKQLELRAQNLTPAAINAADRRAETVYQKHFSAAGAYTGDIVACQI